MKTDIWMPIYIRDYLSSTSRLTNSEHGVYLLLLFDYWMNGPLPNNIDTLIQVARMPFENNLEVNRQVMIRLLSRFFILDEKTNSYKNERIEIELSRAKHNREIAQVNGKKGGRPKKENLRVNRPVNLQGKLNETSSPSPSDILNTMAIPTGFADLFLEWIEHRKAEKMRGFKSESSLKTAVNELVKISSGEIAIAKSIVNKSIANGWTGLFPLKTSPNFVPPPPKVHPWEEEERKKKEAMEKYYAEHPEERQ